PLPSGRSGAGVSAQRPTPPVGAIRHPRGGDRHAAPERRPTGPDHLSAALFRRLHRPGDFPDVEHPPGHRPVQTVPVSEVPETTTTTIEEEWNMAKNLIVNCATCDARTMQEENYAHYETIVINSAALLTSPEGKAVMS